MTNNSVCKICGKDFYVKPSHLKIGWGKYCSMACRNESQKHGKVFRCGICGKSVYKSQAEQKHSASGNFFCSKRCQTLWRNSYYVEERSANWKGGVRIYRQLLKRSGAKPKCALCGMENEIVLTVHHKDHNRSNNSIDNLIWLCLNCHYLAHHNTRLDKSIRTKNR